MVYEGNPCISDSFAVGNEVVGRISVSQLQLWTPRSRPEGTRLREVPLLYMVTKIVFLSHSLLFPPVWEKKVSALRMLMLDILASCFPRLV